MPFETNHSEPEPKKNPRPDDAAFCPAEYYPHLKECVPPIMASLEIENDTDDPEENFWNVLPLSGIAANVDYYEKPDALNRRGFKNGGEKTYVISPVDDTDKFSMNFTNCTGLTVAGYEKETGRKLSFLSHQDPLYFLKNGENQNRFTTDLDQCLSELKDRCDEGTVDAVIVGGNYITEKDSDEGFNDARFAADIDVDGRQNDYRASIRILSAEVEKILGFEPSVISGPKKCRVENIYYANGSRKLVISRNKKDQGYTESFLPHEMDDKEKMW